MNEVIYLAHHGIKGQKWYVRRYQNEDGTLTAEGRRRYYDKHEKVKEKKLAKDVVRSLNAAEQYKAEHQIKKENFNEQMTMHTKQQLNRDIERYTKDAKELLKLAKKEGIKLETYEDFIRFGKSGSQELLVSAISAASSFVLGPLGFAIAHPIASTSIVKEVKSKGYTLKKE